MQKKNNLDEIKKEIIVDFLIISKDQSNKFINQLHIKNLPIKIEKFVEQVNLEFLKNKFKSQAELKIGDYNLNLNSRQISKDNSYLDLTEREANLILYLNKSHSPVSVNKLQKEVWEYGSELETHTVETHIYRLRKKIEEKFKDNDFIVSSKKGYIIN